MGLKETIPLAICKNIEQIKPLWAHSTLPIQSVFLQKRPRHWKNAYLKAVRIRVMMRESHNIKLLNDILSCTYITVLYIWYNLVNRV